MSYETRATSKRKKFAESSVLMNDSTVDWQVYQHRERRISQVAIDVCQACKNIVTRTCREQNNCSMHTARENFRFLCNCENWQSLSDRTAQWKRVKKASTHGPFKQARVFYVGEPVRDCMRKLIHCLPLFVNTLADAAVIDMQPHRKSI